MMGQGICHEDKLGGDMDNLLGGLSPEQHAALMAIAQVKNVKRGHVLLEHGDDGSAMCLLLEGVCKVCLYSASGKEVILDYLGPAQIVGELSLFDGKPRAASVVMVEAGRVAIFQRRDMLAFLAAHPDTAVQFIRVLCGRLRKTNELLESYRAGAMGPKLARGILRLLADHGDADSDGSERLRFRISQSDLGSFVSLSRENVNRQLSDWQADGYVLLQSGQIEIRDREALEDIAEFYG